MTEIKLYRKKPVEVEAMEYTELNIVEVCTWLQSHGVKPGQTATRRIAIHTLEGTIYGSPGDYIIRGVQGEFYPCKPDIFKQTYDLVVPWSKTDAIDGGRLG